MLLSKRDWREKVYKRKGQALAAELQWKNLRDLILARDDYRCLRCDARFRRALRSLTVHHLIPREEGGTDEERNLVTLCKDCHDFVEIAGLRTIIEIQESYEDPYIDKRIIRKDAAEYDYEEKFKRPAWHSWVYGGERKPSLGNDENQDS